MRNIDLDRIKLTSEMAFDNNYNQSNLNIIFGDNPQYLASSYQEAKDIKLALDSVDASFNTPSSGVPAFMTTIYTNQVIKQITQKVAFREIGGDYQQGSLETNSLSFPTIAFSGNVSDYDDKDEPNVSDINLNYENRGVYRYSTSINYGDLEVATLSAAKIDAISLKREGAARKLVLVQNDIFFNGFARGKNIRGLLNDSDLNAAIPSPASVSKPTSAKWKYKEYTEIVNDILLMFNGIVDKLANNVNLDTNTPMILCLSPQDQTYLVKPNIYGRTALDYIKSTFPSIRVVTASQYKLSDADSGNLCQLILDKVNDVDTVSNGFTFQAMYSNTVVGMSSIKQKASTGVAGAIIRLPAAIATMTGI
jgi:hypothetical protein